MTDFTLNDTSYVEEIEVNHYEYLANETVEVKGTKVNFTECEDRETVTEFTAKDVPHLEEIELDHLGCHTNTNVNSDIAKGSNFGMIFSEHEDKGIMTEFTLRDISHLEEIEIDHQECFALKNVHFEFAERSSLEVSFTEHEDKGMITEFTMKDVSILEEIELDHQGCLTKENIDCDVAKVSNFGMSFTEREDKSIMTEFTMHDVSYLEEIRTENLECIMNKNDENNDFQFSFTEHEEKACMTELSVTDLVNLVDFEKDHQFSVIDGKQTSNGLERKDDKSCETDLGILELEYLQEFESFHQNCAKFGSNISSVNATASECMTELTLADIQYLEEISAAHKMGDDILGSESSNRIDSRECSAMTDLTIPEVEYLEQLESVHNGILDEYKNLKNSYSVSKENKEAETKMTLKDLEYLDALEAFYNENAKSIEELCGVRLGLLSDFIENGSQNGYKEPEDQTSVPAWKSTVDIMSDICQDDAAQLEEFECMNRCLMTQELRTSRTNIRLDSRKQSIVKSDSDVDTDLTISEVEKLEEAGTLCYGLSVGRDTRYDKNVGTVLTLNELEELENTVRWLANEYSGNNVLKNIGAAHNAGASSEHQSMFVSMAKLEYDEPGFDSIQVVLKPSQKQESIRDTSTLGERSFHDNERPKLTRRSSSTVSVSSADSWGRRFIISTNVNDKVGSQDDLAWLQDVDLKSSHADINKDGNQPSKLVWKTASEKDISPEVCDIEKTFPDQFGPVVEETRGIDTGTLEDEGATGKDFSATNETRESAVVQCEQFLRARAESERTAMLSLVQSNVGNPSSAETSVVAVKDLLAEKVMLMNKMKELEDYNQYSAEVIENLEKDIKNMAREESKLKNEKVVLTEKLQEFERTMGPDEVVKENADLRGQIKELSVKETQLLRDQIEELKDYKNKSVEIIDDLMKENAVLTEKTQETGILEHLVPENEELKARIRKLEESLEATSKDLKEVNDLKKEQVGLFDCSDDVDHEMTVELRTENKLLKDQLEKFQERCKKIAEGSENFERENKLLREHLEHLGDGKDRFIETSEALRKENELYRDQIQQLESEKENYFQDLTQEVERSQFIVKEIEGQRGKCIEKVDELTEENDQLRSRIQELTEMCDKFAEITKELKQENEKLKCKIREDEKSLDKYEEAMETITLENKQLKVQIQELEGNFDKYAEITDELEKDNTSLRDKVMELEKSNQITEERGLENSLLREKIQELESTKQGDLANEELELLYQKIEQLKEAEQKIGLLNETNSVLRNKIEEIQSESTNDNGDTSQKDGWSETEKIKQELEKVKKENRELFEELMELRRKAKEAAAEPVYIDNDSRPSSAHVKSPLTKITLGSEIMMDETSNDSHQFAEDLQERIDELSTLKLPESPVFEDVEISSCLAEIDVLEDDDMGEVIPLPPLPLLPPPAPSDHPSGLTDDSAVAFVSVTEDILAHSPPRSAANLRSASRLGSHVQEPLIQESNTCQVENEPDILDKTTQEAEDEHFRKATQRILLPSHAKDRMLHVISPNVSSPLASKKEAHLVTTDERVSQESTRKVPPPTLPKPKRKYSREWPPQQNSLPNDPLTESRFLDKVDGYGNDDDTRLPPRGNVLARAASINQGQLDALNEKIVFLEKQLKNKENVIRTMRVEATELETQAMLERRDKEVKILEEEIAFLKQENQKKERELLAKIGEINRKGYEVEQWKAEANSSERQKKRMEAAYLNLQNQLRALQTADSKLAELKAKHSGTEKHNWELSEKVKKLEKTEKEFKDLEYNIQVLQNQLQDLESVERERDELLQKLAIVEQQRDELLRKGREVENERNDFLRNNKMMEMHHEDLESRYEMMCNTNASLQTKLAKLEQEFKEVQNKSHDALHERNFVQAQCNKIQAERDELQKRLSEVTQERNRLENLVAELQDFNREHLKLEEGFHTLRLKVAELTRQKDDAEMQIPTLKAKTALLKQACKEKDGLIDKLNDEVRELRHSIATSTLDDFSKIRSYGYSSPESYVKFARKSEYEKSLKPKNSVKGSSRAISASKPYVALFDYDPYKSNTSGHPELELTLKKGDQLTIFGEMDLNGYFEAELNGVKGIVPSLFVEEVDENVARLSNEKIESKKLRDSLMDPDKEPFGSFSDVIPLKQKPDNMSSGHNTMSGANSLASSELQRQCFVALYDYNPYQSCTTDHPERELAFKKGDILTIIGDMDPSGYYKAEMNGRAGLVPSNFVEEVSSSTYLQSSTTKAPEQILGVFDNIQVPGRSPGREIGQLPIAQSSLRRTYPSDGVIQRTQFPGTVTVNVRPVSSYAHLPGFYPTIAIPPAKDLPTIASNPAPLVPVSISSRSPQAKSSVIVGCPGNLNVLRTVNKDGVLLGWTLPDMDEFGQSHGIPVQGYRILADGHFKMDITSPYMSKALVEELDLQHPIQFAIQTVGKDGSFSKKVSAKFTDVLSKSFSPSQENGKEYWSDEGQEFTLHVALYDYDPFKSSPNPNPAYELAFKEGDILRVTDTSRKDGFYHGELRDQTGLIPSNFVEEVAVAPSRRLGTRADKHSRQQEPKGAMSQSRLLNGSMSHSCLVNGRVPKASPPSTGQRKTMVALYDYVPEEQSPQDNPDSELPFKKGQIITVLGDMNQAGFYQAEISGQCGLVPSSFVEEFSK